MEEKAKKKNGCLENFMAFVLMIALIVWGIRACSNRTEDPENEKASEIKAEKTESEKAEEEKKKAMELAEQDKTTVWRIVKDAVKEKLLSPRSASFPFAGWEYVECNDPGIYFVRAYVDSKNAYGVEIRQEFFAKVVKYQNGRFEIIQLTFR